MSWVDEMLSEVLLLDEEIKYRKRQMDEAIERKADYLETLEKVRRKMGSQRFNCAYDHLVRGMSISECARKYGYAPSGVCKICADFRKKADAIGASRKK